MKRRNSWLEHRVDMLLQALADLGMSMSRKVATEIIQNRVEWVAEQMGVTETTARRYLTDDALKDWAVSLAFDFVDENPGADLIAASRDATISLRLVGRAQAGLAHALMLRVHADGELEDVREELVHLAEAQSTLGLILADQDTLVHEAQSGIRVPAALLRRVSRYLDAAAELADTGVILEGVEPNAIAMLPSALRRDAAELRKTCGDGSK